MLNKNKYLKAIMAFTLTTAFIVNPVLATDQTPIINSSQFELNQNPEIIVAENTDLKNFNNPVEFYIQHEISNSKDIEENLNEKDEDPCSVFKKEDYKNLTLRPKDKWKPLKDAIDILKNIIGSLNKLSSSKTLVDVFRLSTDLIRLDIANSKNAVDVELLAAKIFGPEVIGEYIDRDINQNIAILTSGEKEFNKIAERAVIETIEVKKPIISEKQLEYQEPTKTVKSEEENQAPESVKVKKTTRKAEKINNIAKASTIKVNNVNKIEQKQLSVNENKIDEVPVITIFNEENQIDSEKIEKEDEKAEKTGENKVEDKLIPEKPSIEIPKSNIEPPQSSFDEFFVTEEFITPQDSSIKPLLPSVEYNLVEDVDDEIYIIEIEDELTNDIEEDIILENDESNFEIENPIELDIENNKIIEDEVTI